MAYKAISKSEAKRFIHEVRKAHDVIIDRTYARKDTVTAAANGLTPQLPSIDAATKYLDGNGQWTTPDYTLPTMSPTVKGGAKNGTGLVMAEDTVNVDLRTAVESVSSGYDEYVAASHGYFVIPESIWALNPVGYYCSNFSGGADAVEVEGVNYFGGVASRGTIWISSNEETPIELISWEDLYGTSHITAGNDGTVEGYIAITDTGDNAMLGSQENEVVHLVAQGTTQTSVGKIIIGNNLSLTGDTLNASGSTYELPTMSPTVKGGAKNGAGLVMTGDNEEVVEVDLRTAITNDENIIEVREPGEIPCLVRNFYSNITESEGTDLLSVYLILDKGFDINKAKFYAEDQTELIRGEHFEFFPESEYSNPYLSFYKKGMDILNNQSLLIKMIDEQQIAKIQIKDGLELNNNNLSVNLATAITINKNRKLLTAEILKEYQYSKYGSNQTLQGINLDLNQDKFVLYCESDPTDPESEYYEPYIIILTNDLNNCEFYFDENEEWYCDISWKEYHYWEEKVKIDIPKTELIPYIGTFNDVSVMSKDYVLSEDFQETPPCIYAYISKSYPSVANLKIKEGLTLDTEGISAKYNIPGNGLRQSMSTNIVDVDFTDTTNDNAIPARNSSFIISNPDSYVRNGDQGLRLLSIGRHNVIDEYYIDIQAGFDFSGIRIGSGIQDYYFEEDSGNNDYYYDSGNNDYYYDSGNNDYYYDSGNDDYYYDSGNDDYYY